MNPITKFNAIIRVPERIKLNRATNQYETVSPEQDVRVFIEIDDIGLAKMLGGKAWRNKSRKAHECGGLVRCIEVRAVK